MRREGKLVVARRNPINPEVICPTCSRQRSFVRATVILIIPTRLFSKRVSVPTEEWSGRTERGRKKAGIKKCQKQGFAICAAYLARQKRAGVGRFPLSGDMVYVADLFFTG